MESIPGCRRRMGTQLAACSPAISIWKCRKKNPIYLSLIHISEANQSMVSTHDRMPFIVEPDQMKDWVLDDTKFSGMLKQTPVLLETKQEYDQQELKFL